MKTIVVTSNRENFSFRVGFSQDQANRLSLTKYFERLRTPFSALLCRFYPLKIQGVPDRIYRGKINPNDRFFKFFSMLDIIAIADVPDTNVASSPERRIGVVTSLDFKCRD